MPGNPLLVEARRLSSLGPAFGVNPLTARKQVRVDISPSCLSFYSIINGKSGNFYFEPTTSLDAAFTSFDKQASSRNLLSRGTVILFNINSDLFKTTPIDVGPTKQYKRVAEVDILARRDPAQLRLDPARFCYRAFKISETQAHLISLDIGSSELLNYDARGIRVERYSSVFSAVDYLLDRHEDYFATQTLLCVADNVRGYLFAIRRGAITGIRTIARSALTSPKEFRDTAQNFSFDSGSSGDGYSIVLSSLTPQIDDLERAGKSMAGEIVTNVGLVGIEDSCAVVPEMQYFREAPQYPFSIFRTGKSNLSLTFYTPREAIRPVITKGQLVQIKFLSFLRILIVIAIIACPIASGIFYFLKSHTPEWNVDTAMLAEKERRVVYITSLQNFVTKALKISNNRIAIGQVFNLIFTDFPSKFQLKHIQQGQQTQDKFSQKTTISIEGTAPEDSLVDIETYVKALDERAKNLFPNFETVVQLLRTDLQNEGERGDRAKVRQFQIQMDLITKKEK